LKWGQKQSCNPYQDLCKGISHTTCMQGNWGDLKLLLVGSQIGNLTSDLSFEYNLCVKCPNGSCEPLLDIWVPRAFEWYKELINPMFFDACNYSMKICEFVGTPIPKVGVHLGVWGFIPLHFLAFLGTWNVTAGLYIWPTPSQAFALVASPKLKLWQMIPWKAI